MKPKRNIPTEPIVVTSIRMTPEQHETLKELAARRHRSVSGELRVAIDQHLAEGESELREAAA